MEINREYFSGAQASIMIGDIWVDDILAINYSNTYSAQPIFGYGSTFYDHIAEGRELIQGSFTINFREPNYLWIILSAYREAYDVNKFLNNQKSGSQRGDTLYSPENQSAQMQQTRLDLDHFFHTNDPKGTSHRIREKKTLTNTLETKHLNASDFQAGIFDIVIGYGEKLTSNSPGERLVGCKIIGKAKTILSNGEPIKESYNFFARKQE